MADPYLNKALTNLRNELNRRWPNRDKRSDGWIGDRSHQATNSDHNPDVGGLHPGSVDALDIDVDGIDVQLTLAAAIHHESTWYVIYNRRITSRTMKGGLGAWHAYYGPSPHTEHIHVNTRETHETSNAPWFAPLIGKEEEDMPTAEEIADAVWRKQIGSSSLGISPRPASDWLKPAVAIERAVAELRSEVADLRRVVEGDTDATTQSDSAGI